MSNKELDSYIAEARAQKHSDELIRQTLLTSGWPEVDVTGALAPAPASAPNLPPPPVPHFGMWVTFQYLLLFITLYIIATSLGGILDHAVDQVIPDVLDNASSYSSRGDDFGDYMMKGYIAAILVAFPIFFWLFIALNNNVLKRPAIKNIRARKLLIYFTLVVTFIIMIGHLITTLFSFLNGSESARTYGHLGVTLIVAGSIFTYLIVAVKGDRKLND